MCSLRCFYVIFFHVFDVESSLSDAAATEGAAYHVAVLAGNQGFAVFSFPSVENSVGIGAFAACRRIGQREFQCREQVDGRPDGDMVPLLVAVGRCAGGAEPAAGIYPAVYQAAECVFAGHAGFRHQCGVDSLVFFAGAAEAEREQE